MSKVDLDRFTDFMVEYKKEITKDYEEEIEKLNKENKELDKACARKSRYIDKKDLEIGRLNYIINEIKECLSKNRVYISGERNLAFELDDILKGVDKE